MSTTADTTDPSASDLVKQLADQTSALVRQELELARAELTEKGKAAGVGVGMFSGAGLVAFFAFGALTACLILALATAVKAWLAALIVTAVYAGVAGLLAVTGRGAIKRATPPAPEQAIETTKEDLAWAKTRAKSARS